MTKKQAMPYIVVLLVLGVIVLVAIAHSNNIINNCIEAGYAGAEYIATGGWRCIGGG